MKVKKDNVIKEINDEALLADYLTAGWEKVEERKIPRLERIDK